MYHLLGSLFPESLYQIERVHCIDKNLIGSIVCRTPLTKLFMHKFYFVVAKNISDGVTDYFLILHGERIDWFNVYQIMKSFGLIPEEIDEDTPLEKCVSIIKYGNWKVRTEITFLPDTPYTYKTVFEIR